MTKANTTIVTIPQKQAGTGTIHDIASALHDRIIGYPAGDHYAVVLAAYYRQHSSTHATLEDALVAGECWGGYSYQIVSDTGECYAYDGTHLGNVDGER